MGMCCLKKYKMIEYSSAFQGEYGEWSRCLQISHHFDLQCMSNCTPLQLSWVLFHNMQYSILYLKSTLQSFANEKYLWKLFFSFSCHVVNKSLKSIMKSTTCPCPPSQKRIKTLKARLINEKMLILH